MTKQNTPASLEITTRKPAETIRFGMKLAHCLGPGDILCLLGNLGSGKTTFVKGIAKGLRIDPKAVNSPTFVLLNLYRGRLALHHFDLYRIEQAKELFYLDYEEYFYGQGITVVEWAERLKNFLPAEFLKIELSGRAPFPSERRIRLTPVGHHYQHILEPLRYEYSRH